MSVLGLLTSICHSVSMSVLLQASENEHLWTGVTKTDERKQALRALCIGCCISNRMVANCTMSPLGLTPVFLHIGLLMPGKICHSQ